MQAKRFFKGTSSTRAGELLILNRNQLRTMIELTAKRTQSFKADVLQLEVVDSPMCCRCEEVFEPASHELVTVKQRRH